MKSIVKSFTEEQLAEAAKLEFTMKLHGVSCRAWVEAAIEYKTKEYYLKTHKTWEDWLRANAPWALGTIQHVLQDVENEKLIAETTGEPIIRRSHKSKTEISQSAGEDADSPQSNNKPASSDHPRRGAIRKIIAASKGPLTAAAVAEAQAEAETIGPLVDEGGYKIPIKLIPNWQKRDDFMDMMQMVSQVKNLIIQAKQTGDPVFLNIHDDAISKLTSVYHMIKNARPALVCGICHGRLEVKEGNYCHACHGTGFMSVDHFKLNVPVETQMVRGFKNETAKGLPNRVS